MSSKPTYEELEKRISELEKTRAEYRKLKDELHNHKERLRLLTDQSLLAIIIMQDKRIVYANNAYAELTGYPLGEILTWTTADTIKLIHPDYREFVLTQADKKMSGEQHGVIVNYRYIGVKKNGTEEWVDQYSQSVSYKGAPADMICMINIHQRRQAQDAMRRSEERYRALFDRSMDGVFIHDFNGNFTDANPAMKKFIGYGKDELPTLDFSMLLSGDELAKVWNTVEQLKRNGYMEKPEEFRVSRKDGKMVDLEVISSVIYRDGEPYAVQGIARDITERKKAEAALQQSEERFRDLYENAPIAYFSAGIEDTKIIRCNRAALDMTGYSLGEVLELRIFDLYPDNPEDKARATELYERLKRGEEIQDEELRIKHKSGRNICVSYSVVPVKDPAGKVIGSRSMAIDISVRKQLLEHFQKSQKMEAIATLAGGVAHQFNNALSIIKGNVDLLKLGFVSPKDFDRCAAEMESSVSKMTGLTGKLLAYAEGGKYQARTISLKELIQEALTLVRYDSKPSVRIETDICEDDIFIHADKTQMRLVLTAIFNNSVEATHDQGRIAIHCTRKTVPGMPEGGTAGPPPGTYAFMAVSDDGEGMDKATLDRVFDPFFSTRFQGRGLGMAAAYGIIKNHNGWIFPESRVGKGTTVKIFLPVAGRGKGVGSRQ